MREIASDMLFYNLVTFIPNKQEIKCKNKTNLIQDIFLCNFLRNKTWY